MISSNLNSHLLFSSSLTFLLTFTSNPFPILSGGPEPGPKSYVVSCGSSRKATDSDGRTWVPDSVFLVPPASSVSSSSLALSQDPSLPSPVPYMSARIFTSPASYNFPVPSKGRLFLRLYLYPSTYGTLNPSDAFFGITANGFTLLWNFSASITAQALTQAFIIKEYALSPVPSGNLNLTFSPSLNHTGAYAFVNGIEIVPVPDMFREATMVGFSDQAVDMGGASLETLFRLNVGGQYIGPTNDSGLTRTWYDDTPYLFGAATGVTSESDKNVTIEYSTDTPKYVAPLDVYSTARTMGPDPKVNRNYNLTWVFQVDPNFTYITRFHFCDYLLGKVNQRAFDIFVNNQTAQESADVIAWSGSRGAPVYKDYAKFVSDRDGDEVLWVALHPCVSMNPEYYDAILNGLEIFKVSDTTGNLAGPNPVPSKMLVEAEARAASFAPSKSSGAGQVIGVVVGCLFGFIVVVSGFLLYRRMNYPAMRTDSHVGNWLPLYSSSQTSGGRTASSRSSASSHLLSLAGGLCRHFSLYEISCATKNFDESKVIGVGGFGKVYLGIIDGGTKVAIKRSNPLSEQGVHEFETEIEMLSKLRHKHLVSLIGFCEDGGEMALVYDYMANGTLRDHIYGKGNNWPTLSWNQRLEICIGAARGLHYLHTGAKYMIIHRDVKTTNILLDEKWVAKVSDFGLSKTGPNLNQTHVSTVVKGSFGYLDPEYFRRQQLTEKSDVYSFGVVLFEVLCGRPALNPSLPKEQVSLADWARHCQCKGTLHEIVDPCLEGQINEECFGKFVQTVGKCLSDQGPDRPSMGDVLWNLEFALQLQKNPGGAVTAAEETGRADYGHDQNAMHRKMLGLDVEEGSGSGIRHERDDSDGDY